MDCLNYTCIGESHIRAGKVCQDYSLSFNLDGVAIAVVCDGHGSPCYVRSNKGAEFAAETFKVLITEFVDNFDKSLIIGKPFTQCPAKKDRIATEEDELQPIFNQLFKSILTIWYKEIELHISQNPFTETEKANFKPEWIADFEKGVIMRDCYGCTLLATVVTSDYWFAIHIGDGKIVSLKDNTVFQEPVPWDDRCFGNQTTSMCAPDAMDLFRYCYGGSDSIPDAIFLCSDGVENGYETTNKLCSELYVELAKRLVANGKQSTFEDIKLTLPSMSKKSSRQDDMSLAIVYDLHKLSDHLAIYEKWKLQSELQNIDSKIAEYQKRKIKKLTEKQAQTTEYQKVLHQKKQAEKDVAQITEQYTAAQKEWQEMEEKVNALLSLFSSKKHKVDELSDSLSKAEAILEKLKKELDFSERALQIAENEVKDEDEILQQLLTRKNELMK
jgi:hypothetical protein